MINSKDEKKRIITLAPPVTDGLEDLAAELLKPYEPAPEAITGVRVPTAKPEVKLKTLEKTGVHTPTESDYRTLMRVYECGGWEWVDAELPTKDYFIFQRHKQEICVDAQSKFSYSGRSFYKIQGYVILTPLEFYTQQNITSAKIQEINLWFDQQEKKK